MANPKLFKNIIECGLQEPRDLLNHLFFFGPIFFITRKRGDLIKSNTLLCIFRIDVALSRVWGSAKSDGGISCMRIGDRGYELVGMRWAVKRRTGYFYENGHVRFVLNRVHGLEKCFFFWKIDGKNSLVFMLERIGKNGLDIYDIRFGKKNNNLRYVILRRYISWGRRITILPLENYKILRKYLSPL